MLAMRSRRLPACLSANMLRPCLSCWWQARLRRLPCHVLFCAARTLSFGAACCHLWMQDCV